jgi:hypothetical protein
LRYKNPSATSLHNEHYQIQPDKEEYFQDWSDELYDLQSNYKIIGGNYNELMSDVGKIDKKLNLLKNFKEHSEQELK